MPPAPTSHKALADDKELMNTLGQIEKTFGKGAIMQLGENSVTDVPGISTGALSLDLALIVTRTLTLRHHLLFHRMLIVTE